MNRVCIILCMIFVFALLQGCGADQAKPSDGPLNITIGGSDNTEKQEGEAVESAAPGDQGIEDITVLIGTWQDAPSIGSMDRQRFHFFNDGNYIFEYSQYDLEKRVLSEIGVWNFEDNTLSLTIFEKVTVEGGEKSVEPLLPGDELNEYAIINGKIKIIELDPPETEKHILTDFFQDNENSPGYWTVMFNDTRYWKYSDSPDVYFNEPFMDGDVFRPWP